MSRVVVAILLALTSCTTLDFKSQGQIKTSIGPVGEHGHYGEIEGVKEFYLWGLLPRKHTVYIDRELMNLGFISAANIKVHHDISFLNSLKGIFSLGLYTPVNYKISAFGQVVSDRGQHE